MLYELLNVLFVDCVHDIEEVGSVGHPALAQPVRKVLHEFGPLLRRGPEVTHRQLVKCGHVDELDGVEWKELLIPR